MYLTTSMDLNIADVDEIYVFGKLIEKRYEHLDSVQEIWDYMGIRYTIERKTLKDGDRISIIVDAGWVR